MNNTNYILNGDIKKNFVSYLIPCIFGMLGASLYVLGDTMIVGRFLGAQGLAALNISIPVINLFTGLGLLFGVGAATSISINKGKSDNGNNNSIFTISLILSLVSGLIIFTIKTLYLDKIVYFMGATENTFTMAKDYLNLMLGFSWAFILNTCLSTLVRNDGSPKIAMTGMLVSSILNVILDYIFIAKLDLGMWGGALATIMSPLFGIGILSFHFIKKRNSIAPTLNNIDKNLAWRIIKNGFSSLIIELSVGISIFAFNWSILAISGDLGVSAYSIVANLSLICSQVLAGVGQAIQPLVSINYGARNYTRTKETLKLGIKTSLILGLIFFVVAFSFPNILTSIFINESNPQLISMTVRGIKLYFSCFLFMGINVVLTSYAQAIEHSRMATIMSLLKGFIVLMPILLIIPNFLGLDGVWLSLPITEFMSLIIFYLIFRKVNILQMDIQKYNPII